MSANNITNLVGNLEGSARHNFKRCANNQMQGNATTRFFFISNARLKLAKNQADAKQHPEAEFLLFENYSNPLSML